MTRRPPGNIANQRRKAVKQALQTGGPSKKALSVKLGITLRRVYQIAKEPDENPQWRSQRFVAKALRYTRATHAQIAERAGTTPRQVNRIAKRDGIKRKYPLKTGPKIGSKRENLTKEQVAKIRQLGKNGKISQTQLAKMFNVTQPCINRILRKG